MVSIYHLDYFIVKNSVQEGERSKGDENTRRQMKARHWERLNRQWWELRKFRHTLNPGSLNANDAVKETPCS